MAPTASLADLDPLRGPLTGYCYRMLGGATETDDAVQETLARAVAKFDTYDPDRARLTTWVHRIAHNVCVDLLRGAGRRAAPMDVSELGEPGVVGAPRRPGTWLDPMPDHRVLVASDPAARVVERESIRLAFVAAIQYLTPPQRSALILRDVLGFSAAETAEILGITPSAAHSALARARAQLAAAEPAASTPDVVAHDLVERYIAAFEAHDVDGLIDVLHEDATTSMPPLAWWLRGGPTIASLMAGSDACAHDRLVPTDVNGWPGVAQYRPDAEGRLKPFSLVAFEFRDERIVHVTTFLGALSAEFPAERRIRVARDV
ncbi:RNA polymerase subunit sigma-70 [Gordonia asplenii]|uniref:RNA polymerase subunit sigma-70 n=1 Tax=Gordonia asplenii TaxID=2725283 RepID=UPI0028A9EA01|nr:RNA polymerase subunit sigma-70 [Gordonia asplenii]